jgi:DNA-binding response OmpR family regulator
MTKHNSHVVLIIEDDADIRFGLAVILEDEGYTVVTAPNGREALKYLREAPEPPCLILLDLMMPDMDGWQFRAEQRRDPAVASVPVVVISAAADLQSRTATLAAAAVMQKPIQIGTLLDLVRHFCPTAATRSLAL